MRVGHVSGQRQQITDRNLIDFIVDFHANAVAPHGITLRAAYTVPAGKKARVGHGYLFIRRNTAASTPGIYSITLGTLLGGLLECRSSDNSVDAQKQMVMGLGGTYLAGETFELYTADSSSGGGVDYNAAVMLEEHDA